MLRTFIVQNLTLTTIREAHVNHSHAICNFCRSRYYPLWLLFATFAVSIGYPRYNPRRHANNDFMVVRVIFQSKNNFYDVIRLKLIENWYFPKETFKVGLEKINQDGGQLKETKLR